MPYRYEYRYFRNLYVNYKSDVFILISTTELYVYIDSVFLVFFLKYVLMFRSARRRRKKLGIINMIYLKLYRKTLD